MKSQKKEGFYFHVIRTFAFFPGKSDVYDMRTNFSLVRTLPARGSYLLKNAAFQLKNVPFFVALLWTKFDHDEPKWSPKLITDPIREMLAQWPSEMSRTHDPPSPPSLLSLPLPSLEPLSSLRERLKPYSSSGKTQNMMIMVTILYPTRGSYSLEKGPNLAVDPVHSWITGPNTMANKSLSERIAIWNVGRIEKRVASLRPRDDIRRPEVRLLRIEVDGPKTSRADNQGFSFQSEKSRRGQTCNRSSEQR